MASLPAYTEISNFNTRMDGKKLETDLSIVLIIDRFSEPVETINSIYNFANQSKHKIEVIIINIDKEGYKYDRLLSAFPALRILLPQEKLPICQAFNLGAQESLSRNILFVTQDFKIRSLDMDILQTYFSQTAFGILIPDLLDEYDDSIPNLVNGDVSRGFLETISIDRKGTALPVLYPKYLCFIINRDMFISRQITIRDYNKLDFVLLELGLRVWREGFLILKVANFRMRFNGLSANDIQFDLEDSEYIRFNYVNFNRKYQTRGRWKRIFGVIVKWLFTLRIGKISKLLKDISLAKMEPGESFSYPMDDSSIFKTIKREWD